MSINLTFNPPSTKCIISTITFMSSGKHSVNIPLSCSVGDYKSKLQLYRDRRGHPSNTTSHPPSSLLPLWYLFQFLQTSPSLSLHHSTAQMHPATDGLTWDSYVTSPSLSQCARTEPIQSRQPPQNQQHNTTSVLHRHTGNMSLHIVLVVH